MYSTYKIKNLKDLHKLNKLASHVDFDVYASVNSTMVNAKSILALLTVLGKEVHIIAPDHIDFSEFVQFVDKLKN